MKLSWGRILTKKNEAGVDLKQKAKRFSSKMGLFGYNRELQFKTCSLMVIRGQVQRNRGEESSFMDLGETVVNKESIGEN